MKTNTICVVVALSAQNQLHCQLVTITTSVMFELSSRKQIPFVYLLSFPHEQKCYKLCMFELSQRKQIEVVSF